MRLIDADALIDDIERSTFSRTIKEFFEDFVDDAPTAYDLDNVVRQLEESKAKAYELIEKPHMDYGTLCGWISATDKAIEIVKRGGCNE